MAEENKSPSWLAGFGAVSSLMTMVYSAGYLSADVDNLKARNVEQSRQIRYLEMRLNRLQRNVEPIKRNEE